MGFEGQHAPDTEQRPRRPVQVVVAVLLIVALAIPTLSATSALAGGLTGVEKLTLGALILAVVLVVWRVNHARRSR